MQSNIHNLPCALMVIITCEGTEECAYEVSAFHKNTSSTLLPSKSHYQIVPNGETDSYDIFIEDDKVENFTVVLNSITGDADLKLYKDGDNFTAIGVSEHEGYIPDLITVKKADNPKNFKGKYTAKVKAETFASYNIYYYTHNSETINNKPNKTATAIELTTGHIIKDYFRQHEKA